MLTLIPPRDLTLPTPVLLRRLRTAMLLVVVGALAGGLSTFLGAHTAVASVRADVIPAVESVSAIWTELRQADAALSGCSTAPSAGSGAPECAVVLIGGDYHSVVADAVQRLAVLAGRNITTADRQLLQVVQGLLIRYLGLVEQAHFYIGQGSTTLAEVYLGYAGDLLRGSIRDELNHFRGDIAARLRDRRGSGWHRPVVALLWLLPLLGGVGLLLRTQLYLTAKFRRVLSWPLAAATFGLLALGGAAAQPLAADGGFERAASALQTIVDAPCVVTSAAKVPDHQLVATIGAAARFSQLEYVMPMLAVAVLALIVVGLQPRLAEYRLRSR